MNAIVVPFAAAMLGTAGFLILAAITALCVTVAILAGWARDPRPNRLERELAQAALKDAMARTEHSEEAS